MRKPKRFNRIAEIKKNIRVAIHTARKFNEQQHNRYDFDILKSISFECLCYAAKRFDPEKKVPFQAYAVDVIQSGLIKYGIAQNRPSRKVDQPKHTVTVGQKCPKHEPVDPVELFILVKKILTKKEYKLVEMMFIRGMRVSQVAKELGVTRLATEKQIEKILQKIKDKFPKLEDHFA